MKKSTSISGFIFLVIVIAGFLFFRYCDNKPEPQPPDTKPVLYVSVDSIDFGETETYYKFRIENLGTADLKWESHKQYGSSWLTYIPVKDELLPDSGCFMFVNVFREKYMKPGTYNDNIIINSNGGDDTVFVSMTIKEPSELPLMIIDPASLVFECIENVDSEKSSFLFITSSNDSDFRWTAKISDNSASTWLKIQPNRGGNKTTMAVMVNAKEMLVGDYTGYIDFTAENVQNTTARVPIVLKVLPESKKPWIKKFEVEKEYSHTENGNWWVSVADSNEFTYLRSKIDCNIANENYAIGFEFEPPDGIDSVYVFVRISITNGHDGFFIGMNYENQGECDILKWFDLYRIVGDGWNCCYVCDTKSPYKFKLKIKDNNKLNTLLLYPGREHAKIDWIAVTDRNDLVLDEVEF